VKKAPCDVASSSECLWRVVLLCDLRALIFAFFAVKGFCLSTDEELLTAKVAKDRKARGENPLGPISAMIKSSHAPQSDGSSR
jgi:hypothetical protein